VKKPHCEHVVVAIEPWKITGAVNHLRSIADKYSLMLILVPRLHDDGEWHIHMGVRGNIDAVQAFLQLVLDT
jgi:hypothetical protein